jgi:hypothetical protein
MKKWLKKIWDSDRTSHMLDGYVIGIWTAVLLIFIQEKRGKIIRVK